MSMIYGMCPIDTDKNGSGKHFLCVHIHLCACQMSKYAVSACAEFTDIVNYIIENAMLPIAQQCRLSFSATATRMASARQRRTQQLYFSPGTAND